MERHDGRAADELRKVRMTPDFQEHPLGSVLIEMGRTQVLCAATVEEKVPPFLNGRREGWITGEYGMLPGSTNTRVQREGRRGRASGRTMEIQRLIGRALRCVVDRKALGERTIWIDCDVLQADGGTRTASITGGFVALCLALARLREKKLLPGPALIGQVAAISVGVVEGTPLLDLDYVEDSAAAVDMNVVRLSDGRYIELQGTAETAPFDRPQLDTMLELADGGIRQLLERQREVLGRSFDNLVLVGR